MMPRYNIRKYLPLAMLAIILIAILWVLFNLTIVSVSASGADITITSADSSVAAKGKNSIFTIIERGTYTIEATNQTGTTRKIVDLPLFHKTDVSLTVTPKIQFTPITNGPVSTIHTISSETLYIDTAQHTLYSETAGQPRKSVFDATTKVYSMEWNGSFGIGTSYINNVMTLVATENGAPVPVKTPSTGVASISYNVKDGNWYVAQGTTLYVTKDKGQTYSRVADISDGAQIIGAFGSSVAILTSNQDFTGSVSVINLTTHQKKDTPVHLSESPDATIQYQWAPDGERSLLLESNKLTVFDKNNTPITGVVPTNITSAFWDKTSTLVYANGNAIWKYNFTSHESALISEVPVYNTVNAISPDNDQIIMRATNSAGSLLFKTSPTEASIDTLKLSESNMLQLTPYCGLYFTNFSTLTIWSNASEDEADGCKTSITSYLDSIGVSTSIPILTQTY